MKIGQKEAEEQDQVAIRAGDLVIEPGLGRVSRGGQQLPLPGLSFDVLLALVRAAPNLVTSERLVEEVWRGQVVSAETITQRIKLLRDALGDDSQNPRYVAVVRGRGYRFLQPVSAAATQTEETAPRVRRPGLWVAALVIAVALGVAAMAIRKPAPASPPDGLAVLPFDNRSARAEDAFFADGIHDDLLTRLSRIRELRVIARGSVQHYRGGRTPLPQIARELGVGAVLTGAVQRAGEQVRIQVQLIDATRNTQLWAETYDRSLSIDNVFAIQSDISRAIASRLEITLRPADRERLERPITSSLEAYEAWLQGRQAMSRYTEEGFVTAVERFQSALAADAEFAQAHAGLAETRLLQERFRVLNRALAIQLAESSAERAIALDPTLAEGFAAKGDVLRLRGDAKGAEEALRQAIALNPNLATAWVSYGWLVAEQGRADEQLEMWSRAARLDPLSPAVRVYGAFTELRAGRVARAEEHLRALLARDPDFPPAHVILGETLAARGDQASAVAHYQRALHLNPNLPLAHAGLVHALLDLGADAEAAEAVAAAWSVPDTPRLGPGLELMLGTVIRTVVEPARMRAMIDELRTVDRVTAAEHAAFLHLQAGDAAAARAAIESAEPRLRDEPQTVPLQSRRRDLAAVYAFALARTGEASRARSLAERIVAESARSAEHAPRRRLAPMIAHATLGRSDAALQLLRDGAGEGKVPAGWRLIESRPELADLRKDPAFAAAIDAIRADAARQRARLRESSE